MARKITLTVPDALYSKIDQWRTGFNLSRIFQDAIAEAIHKKESFQERMAEDHSLPDIISRLKKEKAGWERSITEQAERAGALWASRAHYEDLIFTVNTSSEQLFKMPQIQAQITDTLKQLSTFPDVFNTTVQDSWLRGVRNFWDSVRDKL